MEDIIRCPHGYGNKTVEDCNACQYSNLGDCPVGAYFVWRPKERFLYEMYLVDPKTNNPGRRAHNNRGAVLIPDYIKLEDAEDIYRKGFGKGSGAVISLLKEWGIFKENEEIVIERIKKCLKFGKMKHREEEPWVEEMKQSLRDGAIVMCTKGGGESCDPSCTMLKKCWAPPTEQDEQLAPV